MFVVISRVSSLQCWSSVKDICCRSSAADNVLLDDDSVLSLDGVGAGGGTSTVTSGSSSLAWHPAAETTSLSIAALINVLSPRLPRSQYIKTHQRYHKQLLWRYSTYKLLTSLLICARYYTIIPLQTPIFIRRCQVTLSTSTTKNVRIIVLSSHSCGGILQSLYAKLLHSSMQTSVDDQSGQRQVSHMTDEEGETWSPFGISKVRIKPESLAADCSTPVLQHVWLVHTILMPTSCVYTHYMMYTSHQRSFTVSTHDLIDCTQMDLLADV